jgi:hypothetical protein
MDHLPVGVQSIPYELLATIFAYGSHPSDNQDNGLPFPLLVCSVNRHWRNVALNSPIVWSCIDVSVKQPFDVTERWIKRSKGCLIDVTLTFRGVVRKVDVDVMIDLVVPHVGRWRRFFLDATDRADVEKVLSRVRGAPAPYLRRFWIRNFGYIGQDSSHSPIISIRAPMLHSVQLEHVPLWCSPPLVGLRVLSLNNIRPTYSEIYNIASKCPLLNELILRNFYPNLRPLDPVPTIYFQSLHSLAIQFDRYQSSAPYQSFLAFSCFPKLEYLELSRCRLPDLFEYFPPHRQRPWFPKLHTLRLFNTTISNSVKFLHSLSTITHLQLIHLGDILKPAKESSAQFAGEDELISLRRRCVWPHLKVVTFETFRKPHLDALFILVRHRIETGYPLARIRLSRSIYQSLVKLGRSVLGGREEKIYDIEWFQNRVEVEVLGDPEVGLIG